ncbi:type IX secretion system membrane protein PorP/SprF [uncultured Croceitalea sp.]|uniref:PorP/SprF family type IX secretion system membrane protein n=1 Tax=uncultured Croceitalea sp. TaxID=1798908 RepID=UPI00330597C3
MKTVIFLILLLGLWTCGTQRAAAQEKNNRDLSFNDTFHNQIYFNNYLNNPTLSLVGENKSYLSITHRNQYATFENNLQNYYIGFSNILNETTALGIGVFNQKEGVLSGFGLNANYAKTVKIGERSNLTLGTNITFLSKGIDKNTIVATTDDPLLQDLEKENTLSIKPAITLSLGRFDFGLYASRLLEYNQNTNTLISGFDTQNARAMLQYRYSFSTARGMFNKARLIPMLQIGQNQSNKLSYRGSLLLELPDYGWLQSSIDDFYGFSLGMGVGISKKLSLGYLMEKDLDQVGANLGWNHELSLAYTFKDQISSDYIKSSSSSDAKIDNIVKNYEEQILKLQSKKNGPKDLETNLAQQNRLILDELMLRQDSLETKRNELFEKRFETMVRFLRNEIDRKTQVIANTTSKSTDDKKPSVIYKKKMGPKKPDPPVKTYKVLHNSALTNSNLGTMKSSFYVIINVFKTKKYLDAFIENQRKKEIEVDYFFNKQNGMNYVFIASFDTIDDAHNAIASNLQKKYQGKKWVMQIYNSEQIVSTNFDN